MSVFAYWLDLQELLCITKQAKGHVPDLLQHIVCRGNLLTKTCCYRVASSGRAGHAEVVRSRSQHKWQ